MFPDESKCVIEKQFTIKHDNNASTKELSASNNIIVSTFDQTPENTSVSINYIDNYMNFCK